MSFLSEENFDNKTKAQILLDKLKKKEQSVKFHTRNIGKNTIVFCKNKERIEEYEKSYNDIKNW